VLQRYTFQSSRAQSNDEFPMPPIVTTLAQLRGSIAAFRRAGETVALVPTMGALHSGHLNLVKQAKAQCKRVVVSIFVNPKQFAPHEDFDRYPRQMADDAAKLALVAPDLIWAPTPDEMYPDGFATSIEVKGAALGLETDFRPHFFGGVATVCCKLFSQVTPDIAIFGEKDYQQLTVLKQMVRDLNLPLTIVGATTVREADGLALSSRNAYLTPAERQIAPALHQALQDLAKAVRAGSHIEKATDLATQAVLTAGFAKVDYIAVRDAQTLAELSAVGTAPARILAAAWLGKTRLIDNIGVR
jgi:pantoate--beta-alanine ligase